uniref:Uncharacterized protein n=1 Tax=Populus trichocarpa TaxID=3694 RepID=A9PFQ5_POPTR|nr:unknown [Populus trichocarpa]
MFVSSSSSMLCTCGREKKGDNECLMFVSSSSSMLCKGHVYGLKCGLMEYY